MKTFNQSFVGNEEGNYENIATNKTFFSFEIDALAFVINKNTTFKYDNKVLRPIGISKIGINQIYTQRVSFSFLYGSNLLEAQSK